MTLRERVLATAPNIQVSEVLTEAACDALPDWLYNTIAPMKIVWLPSRVWGQSFKLGAATISLGHLRGDHVATRPWTCGLSEHEAESYLRAHLQGVILHEVGHALTDAFLAHLAPNERRKAWNGLRRIVSAEGPVSTYWGLDATVWDDTDDDQLHEVLAEYFRYYFVDELMQTTHPQVSQFIQTVITFLEPDND